MEVDSAQAESHLQKIVKVYKRKKTNHPFREQSNVHHLPHLQVEAAYAETWRDASVWLIAHLFRSNLSGKGLWHCPRSAVHTWRSQIQRSQKLFQEWKTCLVESDNIQEILKLHTGVDTCPSHLPVSRMIIFTTTDSTSSDYEQHNKTHPCGTIPTQDILFKGSCCVIYAYVL